MKIFSALSALSLLLVASSASAQTTSPDATPGAQPAAPATAAATAPAAPQASAPATTTTTQATVPADAPKKEEDDGPHVVSATFSPLHLIFPEFKAMIEVKASRKVGLAAIGGVGSIRSGDYRFSVWEAGGQARYYLVGTFEHGMELGGQFEYLGVSTNANAGNVSVVGTGSGLALGPFIGYKLATRVGFTLDLQAGVQFLAIGATASASDGQSASARDSAVAPIVNLHFGWSF